MFARLPSFRLLSGLDNGCCRLHASFANHGAGVLPQLRMERRFGVHRSRRHDASGRSTGATVTLNTEDSGPVVGPEPSVGRLLADLPQKTPQAANCSPFNTRRAAR